MSRKLKLSTARNILVFMADSTDHVTGKTGLTLTVTESKAAGAFAAMTVTVTERSNGWYQLALTTTHTNTLGDYALHVTATGADPTDVLMEVVSADPGDVLSWNGTAVATPTTAGVPRVDVKAMEDNVVTAAALATDAVTEIVAGVFAYAHQTGRTFKGAIKRLDQLLTGKHTGMIGAVWAMFDVDGTTKLVEASQDTVAGTRDAASTVAGD